jgi:hypothetical protein
LTGSSGTAKIVCDSVPSPSVVNIDVDESLTYTTDWNTRGGSESKPLLEIIGDEIANQMSRPRQFLSLPITEGNSTNTPHVNLLGNFQDILNSIYGPSDNLITGWTNADYDTFTSSGTAITSAIETGSSGNAKSSSFSIVDGEVLQVTLTFTYNSGAYPVVVLKDVADNNISNIVTLAAGLNVVSLTLTTTGSGTALLWIVNGAAANFSTSDICVCKKPRRFVFNRGNFKVIDREWQTELIEIL